MQLHCNFILLLWTAAPLLEANSFSVEQFYSTAGLDCVSPSFTRTLETCKLFHCSAHCAKMTNCQAFTMETNGHCLCKLFLFDACSHRVQSVPNCTNQVTVYIRSPPGVPLGRLCPPGYQYTRFGTSYKFVMEEQVNWITANQRCSAEAGLSKFADAIDADEASYLLQLQRQVVPGASVAEFFLGGRQSAEFTPRSDGWFWSACNRSVDSGIWHPGQPDGKFPVASCTALYRHFPTGLDDYFCNKNTTYICECQSVF